MYHAVTWDFLLLLPRGSARSGRGLFRQGHGLADFLKVNMMRQTGTVKLFVPTKGYGFIIPDNGGKDVFVYYKDVKGGKLGFGDRVSYEIGKGLKTAKAIKVKVLAVAYADEKNWHDFIGDVPQKDEDDG